MPRDLHSDYKEPSLSGRYITLNQLKDNWLKPLSTYSNIVGKSVLEKDIIALTMGTGPNKVLMWSQMHGNESTTTKAVVDLTNFLLSNSEEAKAILDSCTLKIVPILNPDGAEAYTRMNANNIDLNRDAKTRNQPESRVLRGLFDSFQPKFCFNLHDQRTLFSAGPYPKSATVSFLSPASDAERTITSSREEAMKLIVAMNQVLQTLIPNQVGRYDDSFNENCVGDAFQMEDVPTILFEAGHYKNDYHREQTRKYIFYALWEAIRIISANSSTLFNVSEYFNIPENEKLFFDILVHNAHLVNTKLEKGSSMGIRYTESLDGDFIDFIPKIQGRGDLSGFFGHKVYDCSHENDMRSILAEKKILKVLNSSE
ncbi:M14 family metallopeptidase [Flagellimonas allohymeniacidonis]|uniref:Peptidase M14 n=1 Tax=Flagellimonas allohymeniacidonis TaxID=2517819 RepID=A0A4V2HSQ7_9FLAO|nr:M14 metallopeptidase family protein [Allomuricauda hymeniacidonis]TAI48720.1 peptidase M14 [Allomuricauda hymeniacidonis]